ncbi:MFS transporter [Aeromicrobium sp.]|uniref:MFS transporter n=1 Tax=Aeromicrobium sp. TaxID=1871063 RepID=UPI003C6A31B3
MTVITTPPPAPPTQRRAAFGLAIVLTAQLMLILDMTVVNVALPLLRVDLGFSAANLSWVLNAYALAFGGLLLFGGRLGDVIGRLRTFELGIGLFSVASLLGGLAQSPAMLIASRALQGVGAAIAAPSVLALITAGAPDEATRNRGLALFSAVSSAGASIGLILGGALTGFASWRWALIINVPIGIMAVVLIRRFVPETSRERGRFDVLGAITATAGSVALVYGFINAADHRWLSFGTVTAFAAAAVLLGAFASIERRARQPLLEPSLLRARSRVAALVTMTVIIGAQFSLFFLMVQFMQRTLGLGAFESGLAFLPLSLAIFGISRVTPRLVARFSPWPLIAAGATLGLISLVWLRELTDASTYWADMAAPLLINGIGAGLVFMPITVVALTGVEDRHAGTASGLLQTTQQIGGALGLAVIVTVYASYSVPGEFTPGLREALDTGSILALLAVLIAGTMAVLGRRPARAREVVSASAE